MIPSSAGLMMSLPHKLSDIAISMVRRVESSESRVTPGIICHELSVSAPTLFLALVVAPGRPSTSGPPLFVRLLLFHLLLDSLLDFLEVYLQLHLPIQRTLLPHKFNFTLIIKKSTLDCTGSQNYKVVILRLWKQLYLLERLINHGNCHNS